MINDTVTKTSSPEKTQRPEKPKLKRRIPKKTSQNYYQISLSKTPNNNHFSPPRDFHLPRTNDMIQVQFGPWNCHRDCKTIPRMSQKVFIGKNGGTKITISSWWFQPIEKY